MNEYQKSRFSEKVIASLFNTVTDKQIALLGFAFKKNTGDTRESPAIYVATHLLAEGANLHIYDPKVKKCSFVIIGQTNDLSSKVEPQQIMNDLISSTLDPAMVKKNVFIHTDAYSATKNTHALVVCTEWDEFIVSFELFIGVQYKTNVFRNWTTRESTPT